MKCRQIFLCHNKQLFIPHNLKSKQTRFIRKRNRNYKMVKFKYYFNIQLSKYIYIFYSKVEVVKIFSPFWNFVINCQSFFAEIFSYGMRTKLLIAIENYFGRKLWSYLLASLLAIWYYIHWHFAKIAKGKFIHT